MATWQRSIVRAENPQLGSELTRLSPMTRSQTLIAGTLAAWAWVASACAGSTAAAIDTYHQGRYPEALSAFVRLERSRGAAVLHDTRYTLYRGLTELAVGNAPLAHVWLSATKEALARDPEALDRLDRGRLEAAWHTLGKMPAQMR